MDIQEEPISLDLWGTEELSRHARFLDSHRVQQSVFWVVLLAVELAIWALITPPHFIPASMILLPLLVAATSQFWIVQRIRTIRDSLGIEQLLATPLTAGEIVRFMATPILRRQRWWLIATSIWSWGANVIIFTIKVAQENSAEWFSITANIVHMAFAGSLLGGFLIFFQLLLAVHLEKRVVLRTLESVLRENFDDMLSMILILAGRWIVALTPFFALALLASLVRNPPVVSGVLTVLVLAPLAIDYFVVPQVDRERLLQSEPRVQWRILGER